ncbi:MAG: hypothetical protein HZC41_27000 [Chloroflexi bacterium]|nr:hypothetical protein [Chloroflexota bacterium]
MTLPRLGRRARWAGLLYGLALLLWLSLEDNHVWPVAALGAGLAALLVLLNLLRRLGGRAIPTPYAVAGVVTLGALVGLGAAVATAGLMLFKNALHAHVFLDYPPGLLLAVLSRAPVWTLAGGLVGLGLLLLWMAWAKNG